MKTYTPEELKEILNLHAKWLANDPAGSRADLRGADLRDANLCCSNLRGADLRGAYLRDANLRDADLRDANLRGANLRDANLRDADLRGAYLCCSNLRDANLRDANLCDADLHGADLRDGKIISIASVRFTAHGERGRELLALIALKTEKSVHLRCGCWSGSPDELRKYIAESEERYRASRTLALDTVLMLLAHQRQDEQVMQAKETT